MPKVKMAVARERQTRVLGALCARGAAETAAELSIKAIAADTGLSFDQARSALRALKEAGRVQVAPRILPNGGTAENAYVVTPSGLEVLRSSQSVYQTACSNEEERTR